MNTLDVECCSKNSHDSSNSKENDELPQIFSQR
jgi:hypothetical protein